MFLIFTLCFIVNFLNQTLIDGSYYCDYDIEAPVLNVYPLKKCLQKSEYINISNGTVKVKLKGSSQGSERVIKVFELQESSNERSLSYIVTFKKGFDFAKGGKLNGFSSINTISGGMARTPDKGWSARVIFGEGGKLGLYYYLPTDRQKYGNFRFIDNFNLTTNIKYKINLSVKINDKGSRNGQICMSAEGIEGFCVDDIEFCRIDCSKSSIKKFLFSVFHGGNDPSFAPRDEKGEIKDVYIEFSEITII